MTATEALNVDYYGKVLLAKKTITHFEEFQHFKNVTINRENSIVLKIAQPNIYYYPHSVTSIGGRRSIVAQV